MMSPDDFCHLNVFQPQLCVWLKGSTQTKKSFAQQGFASGSRWSSGLAGWRRTFSETLGGYTRAAGARSARFCLFSRLLCGCRWTALMCKHLCRAQSATLSRTCEGTPPPGLFTGSTVGIGRSILQWRPSPQSRIRTHLPCLSEQVRRVQVQCPSWSELRRAVSLPVTLDGPYTSTSAARREGNAR